MRKPRPRPPASMPNVCPRTTITLYPLSLALSSKPSTRVEQTQVWPIELLPFHVNLLATSA